MIDNKAKKKLGSGGSVLAITINFTHDGLAEFLGHLGYDIVILDGEHGAVDDGVVERFTRACEFAGASPIVRMPVDPIIMERYLGMGVHGFHVARVSSLKEARDVIEAAKFSPLGKRGLGNYRAVEFRMQPGGWPAYIERANANTFVKLAVEDLDGLAALPEIVKIPEIDVVFVGRYDLQASMGMPGETNHPRVTEAYEGAIRIIKDAGKAFGIGVRTADDIKAGHARGARYFLTAVSRTFQRGASEFLAAVRELP